LRISNHPSVLVADNARLVPRRGRCCGERQPLALINRWCAGCQHTGWRGRQRTTPSSSDREVSYKSVASLRLKSNRRRVEERIDDKEIRLDLAQRVNARPAVGSNADLAP